MKADVTAENNPAYPTEKLEIDTQTIEGLVVKTYKDQCGVRLIVVFVDEIIVILIRFTLEQLVEL